MLACGLRTKLGPLLPSPDIHKTDELRAWYGVVQIALCGVVSVLGARRSRFGRLYLEVHALTVDASTSSIRRMCLPGRSTTRAKAGMEVSIKKVVRIGLPSRDHRPFD